MDFGPGCGMKENPPAGRAGIKPADCSLLPFSKSLSAADGSPPTSPPMLRFGGQASELIGLTKGLIQFHLSQSKGVYATLNDNGFNKLPTLYLFQIYL